MDRRLGGERGRLIPLGAILVPFFLFAVMGVVGVSFSPIGRAYARKMSGERPDPEESAALAEVDALRDEVQLLRKELSEVQERVDFAERLLAQVRAKELGPGGGA